MAKQQKAPEALGILFTLRLRPELMKRAQAYAQEEDRSVAYIVRKALEAYLEAR